jgi:hypothetical protein
LSQDGMPLARPRNGKTLTKMESHRALHLRDAGHPTLS